MAILANFAPSPKLRGDCGESVEFAAAVMR
jgi:hypothetical protein